MIEDQTFNTILHHMVHNAEEELHKQNYNSGNQVNRVTKQPQWGFIPEGHSLPSLINDNALSNYNTIFVDYGAGIGNKLVEVLNYKFANYVIGFENNRLVYRKGKEFIKTAQKLILPNYFGVAKLYNIDVFNLTPEKFKRYKKDIVGRANDFRVIHYFYRPMKEPEGMIKFIEAIDKLVKRGDIVIPVYADSSEIEHFSNLVNISGSMYIRY